MDNALEKSATEAAAFQKIWLETMSKMTQAAFTFSPGSPPPEVLRQIRNGIFQALAQSWEEFMRSPQFLEGTRQWMETAIAFRKLSNDLLTRAHNELQSASRNDVDTVLLAVRHMETRLLDKIEELSAQVTDLRRQVAAAPNGQSPRTSARPRRQLARHGKPTQTV